MKNVEDIDIDVSGRCMCTLPCLLMTIVSEEG